MELKQASSGPTTKKIWGAPGPPTGEIWGVKNSTSPPSPSNSLRQISEIFRTRAGLEPGYNVRDFGKCAGNVAGDIFTFELTPGPRVCIRAETYKSESIYSVGYSSTLCVIGVDAGNAVTPSTGPHLSTSVPMSHDRRYIHGRFIDGFLNSAGPKTPNRK